MENTQTVPVPQPNYSNVNPSTSVSVKYAGFWIRFVAAIVDGVILSPINFIIGFVFGILLYFASIELSSASSQLFSTIINLVLTYSYFSLMTYYKGATLGKMLVGIKVESDNFQKLSFGAVLMREIVGKFVSCIILFIGYIFAAFTTKKQALHDLMAHSVVVYKDPSNKNKTGLIIGIVIACIVPILMAVVIFGIISSVVLVSLNSAREKGSDARTQASFMSVRSYAELYYLNNKNSYSVAKDCNSGMFADSNIQRLFADMKNTNVTCYAEGSSYAASTLLGTTGKNWCFDNTGFSGNGVAKDEASTAFCERGSN